MTEPKVAEDAEERGEGICRTCLAPIWNEGGTIGRRKRETGWSDRIERGGDSLVCFKAIEYRHVPLKDREAYIYDVALARGAGMDGGAFDALIAARVRAGVVAEEPEWAVEYGVRGDADSPMSSREAAEHAIERMAKAPRGYRITRTLVERRVSPWVPVKQEGTD